MVSKKAEQEPHSVNHLRETLYSFQSADDNNDWL